MAHLNNSGKVRQGGNMGAESKSGRVYAKRPANDFLGIASQLEMNKNLGVSDAMLIGNDDLIKGTKNFDRGLALWHNEHGRNLRTDAAAWLVPEGVRKLAALLPEHNAKTNVDEPVVEFAYQVEPAHQRADRAHKRTVSKCYAAPARLKGTLLQFGRRLTDDVYNGSESGTSRMAREYAQKVNSYSSTGISSDMCVTQEKERGKDMLGVFTVLWLMQLDVAGGHIVEIGIDANDVRRRVPNNLQPLEEAEAMKAISGLRIHTAALDPLAYVALYTATHRQSLLRASAWLDRYEWPTTDMTVYNGPLSLAAVPRVLRGRQAASQLAATIVSIANTYDLNDMCADGYATALFLYGDRCVNSTFRINCGAQNLFHEIDGNTNRAVLPQMSWALSSGQLTLASQFIGYANAEYLRDLSRSTVVAGLRVRDDSQMRRALTDIDVHALRSVIVRYEAGQVIFPPLHIDFDHYVRRGIARCWTAEGVLHNLVLGRAVGDAISGSSVATLNMPTEAQLSATDVLAYGAEHAEAEATAWLVNELIRNGGMNLVESIDEAVPKSGATAQLHHDCRHYMGMQLQFQVVGFGNDMNIIYHRPTNFVFGPRPNDIVAKRDDEVRPPDVQPMTEIDDELGEEKAAKPVMTAEDIMREVMELRGARRSTVYQRPAAPAKQSAPRYDSNTVQVSSPDAPSRAAIQRLVDDKIGPGFTSGAGALCGANALHMALRVVEDDRDLTTDAINEMLRTALQQDLVPGELNNRDWYSETQMAAIARELGYNLTIVQGQGKGDATAYTTTDIPEAQHLVVFQLRPGHWEGPDRQHPHTRLRLAGGESGTPAVEAQRSRNTGAFSRVLRRGRGGRN